MAEGRCPRCGGRARFVDHGHLLKNEMRCESRKCSWHRVGPVNECMVREDKINCIFCGYRYDEKLGLYGCPNCRGDGLK